MAKRGVIPGFYIASCRQYPGTGLVKVGHTGDLRERLHDSAYVTCFPPDSWQFAATIELPTKEVAFAVETGVLQCFRAVRLDPSELVRAPIESIVTVAQRIAVALGYPTVVKYNPVYGRAPAARRGAAAVAAESTARAVSELLLLHNIVAPQTELPQPTVLQPPLTVSQPPQTELPQPPPTVLLATVQPTLKDEDESLEELDALRTPFEPEPIVNAPLVLREYQVRAATALYQELRAAKRTILQMACRCGKTPVAYAAAELIAAEAPQALATLILVPGLTLLRQTAQKLDQYSNGAASLLLVGSDPRAVALGTGQQLMTTDSERIARWVADEPVTALAPQRWLVCTYQSSELITAHISRLGLIIYDEAHRICGTRTPRPFNSMLLACERLGNAAPPQLFMSATPAYEPITATTISMRDRALFGGVASRYYLREGITARYVNDFHLDLVAVATDGDEGMALGVAKAMERVEKLLVFCRDVAHAERLHAIMQRNPAYASMCIHSRQPPGVAAAALLEFAKPGVRAVLFNCRMLQEGVEIPPLVGVFFAAPRHSPRDIIQSLCRPLNPLRDKPSSVIFLPIVYDPASDPDSTANLQRYTSIVPFIDALLDEDPQLFDMLIGAADDLFRIAFAHDGVAITADTARGVLAACRRVLRHGVAGAAAAGRRPERLLRADTIPWGRAFTELRRVVLECRRYPKTTDEWIFAAAPGGEGAVAPGGEEARVNLHAVYAAIAARYAAGKLEPYQRADLESLPSWLPWGAEGPYAWGPCMEFLERWLEAHGVGALALEINKGGYVGLEATPMERLSGALTCVNQQVFGKKTRDAAGEMVVRAADRVPAAHAADLDRICARFGMRWRKEFRADGTVDPARPTFIQEAYGRFKRMFAEGGSAHPYIQEHFPGYPLKHARQCALDLRTEEALAALPPRRTRVGRAPPK
jgi:superfamily II DNA or RNA helicase